jgi:hypothetical protein
MALLSEREPMIVRKPTLANLAAIAYPSLPVPPITAIEGLFSDIFLSPFYIHLHSFFFTAKT